METATIIIIFFCLLLAVYNRKYIPVALVVTALYMYYVQTNNKSAVYSINGKLYLNSILPVEHFQTTTVSSSPDNTKQVNVLSICQDAGISNSQCTSDSMNQDALKNVLNQFQEYVDKLGELPKDIVDGLKNEEWQFVSKQYVYNVRHQHNNIGELIYHLKEIDYKIFLKLFNEIGYTPDIIETLYNKVNEAYLKKGYLDIKEGSLIEKKIATVREILLVIKEKYAEFQNSSNKFDYLTQETPVFNKSESCKIIKQKTPYNKFNYEVFSNMDMGCPANHYLKGMSFEVDSETGEFNKNFNCCELNSNQKSYQFDEDNKTMFNAKHIINDVNCGNNGFINSFAYNTNNSNDNLIGDYVDSSENASTIFSNSIRLSGGAPYTLESKVFLLYVYKPSVIFEQSDINPIINLLNNQSVDTKFVVANNAYLSNITGITTEHIGFYKDQILKKGKYTGRETKLVESSGNSPQQVGCYVIAYGSYEKIKYVVSGTINTSQPLRAANIGYIELVNLSADQKDLLSITTELADNSSMIVNYNGNYILNQTNEYVNINNPYVKIRFDNVINHWTVFFNNVPIYNFASPASVTTSAPSRMFEFIGTNVSIRSYKTSSETQSITVETVSENDMNYNKVLKLDISDNTNFSGTYIQRFVENNRPVYEKQNNKLIIIKWSIENREWQIKESENVVYKNNQQTLGYPENGWVKMEDDTEVVISLMETTSNIYKEYILLAFDDSIIMPKLDPYSKKFILEKSQTKYSKDTVIEDRMIFNILRNGPNIHLKNKLLNIYAGITNENKLVLSTIETKTDFELMDLVNSYSLRIPNENNLVSINRLVLGIEASLNLRNPNQNQRFQIVNINKDTALNINQYTRCYTNEQSLDALESLKTLTIDLGSSVNDLDKKELLCNNNEHMVELIKTDNTLGIKCRENSKLNEQGKIINSKRSEFFKMTVNNFYHSHDFIVQDPIHNKFNVQSDLTYNSPKMDNQLELYSMKYGTYLNQTSAYKPLEKLFIFILMLKSQNIKNVKIDVESLYDYFSKQVVVDQYYELLVNNSI